MKNKICALILSIFLICGMFLLENLIFGRASYGGGSVGRPIQSLPGYEGCPWKISVLVFLLWIWILRTFGLMLASAFVLILTVGTYQMVRVLGECMLAGSVSYFLYMAIGLQSGLVILHYVNLAAYLAAAPLIKSEININLAGFPVNPLAAAVTVGIAVYIGLMLWLFRRFDKNRDERLPDVRLGIPGGKEAGIIRRSVEKRMKKKEYSVNVGMEEMYKLLIVKKSVLILSIILGVQIFLYPGRTYIAPPGEIYERYCMRQLQGEIGEHQTEWLAREQERLMENRDSVQMEREVMDGKILPLTEHLNRLKEKEGEACYIGQTGYEKLFGTDGGAVGRKTRCCTSCYCSARSAHTLLWKRQPI